VYLGGLAEGLEEQDKLVLGASAAESYLPRQELKKYAPDTNQ
jgi:hypothetical protein